MRYYLFFILLLLSSSIYGLTRRVLFIGNSYTLYGNLPQVTADLASSVGDNLIFSQNAIGYYTLEMHAENSTTLGLIRQGGWEYVVLQEFSTYPSEPMSFVEANVLPYAAYLNDQIHAYNAGAETMFYMTWGRKNGDPDRCPTLPEVCTYEGMDDLTRERYMYMAQINQAVVSPVGAVWRYIREHYPSIELYADDGSHPSNAGSYAAACCFYAAIFRKDPSICTYNYVLSQDDAELIRTSAKAVVYDHLADWYLEADISDYQPPTVPTGVYANDIGETSFKLSWNASSDNIGVSSYDIFMNNLLFGNTTGTSYWINGLSENTHYTMSVKAKDAAGNISSMSSPLQVVTLSADNVAPTVPTGLASDNITQSGFTLSWTSSSDNVGVTGYDVYGNGVLMLSVSGPTAYLTGLSALTTYRMTVRAKDASGNVSAASSPLIVTTPDTESPSTPTGLTAVNLTETDFTLIWGASTDNVGVLGYDVYRNDVLLTSVSMTKATITGLEAFTTYSMAIIAKDASGNVSDMSGNLEVTTPDMHVPTVPAGLSSSNITQSGFALSWTASTDNVGVIGYDVYNKGVLIMAVADTSVNITDLPVLTTCVMMVRARDAAGNASDASNLLKLTTPDLDAPTVPTGLQVDSVYDDGFAINWDASTDNVGVESYDVYQNGTLVASVHDTSITMNGLRALTTYVISIRARDLAGNLSDYSNELSLTTSDVQPPTSPTNLQATEVSSTAFTLGWSASEDNSEVVGYYVYCNDTLIAFLNGISYNIRNLTPGITYSIVVLAEDMAGNLSVAGDPFKITLLDGSLAHELNMSTIIYPNPVHDGIISIDLGMEPHIKIVIEIIDMQGKIIYKTVLTGNNRPLQISPPDMRSGSYNIRIIIGSININKILIIN